MEFQEFTKHWNGRAQTQNEHSTAQLRALKDLQKEEKTQFIGRLEKELNAQPKPSAELLNLKRIQELLLKQQKYGEALLIRKNVEQLENEEQKRWEAERKKKILLQQANFEDKQGMRAKALRLKLKGAEDELERMRLSEMDKLFQKYHNTKKGLQNHQITQLHHLSSN